MIRSLLFFIVLVWSPVCFPAGQANDEWTLEKVMQERARIKQSKAKFKEVKTAAALTSPSVSEGDLLYRAPAYLEKHYLTPDDILIQIKGQGIWITQGEDEQQYIDLDSIPVLQAFVESLRGTLAGDIDGIKKYYRVEYTVTQGKWRMDLRPHEKSVSQYIDVIIITGQQADVLSIEVRESDGDISTTYIESGP